MAVLALAWLSLLPVARAEQLTLAIGQRGNWDTSVAELGQRAGIFTKHDLELDLLYTAGGGETQQAVLSRSVDIGVAVGTLGVLGAASKGAPVRIISGEMTGATDLYWYVRAASPARSVDDLAGRTVGFSTVGSSSNSVALMAQAQYGVTFRLTATGGSPGTFTQVMSGQVDAGWANAPFGVDGLQDGKIRAVFRGGDIKAAQGQTVRVLITHAATLGSKKPAITRFMQAYRETLDYMYGSPDAIRAYAAFAGVSSEIAQQTRDQYFPKAALDPGVISGLDAMMADGVKFKFLPMPLSPAQLKQVVAIDEVKP
jgi:NitT/TauT family transport system substrate-binding protein